MPVGVAAAVTVAIGVIASANAAGSTQPDSSPHLVVEARSEPSTSSITEATPIVAATPTATSAATGPSTAVHAGAATGSTAIDVVNIRPATTQPATTPAPPATDAPVVAAPAATLPAGTDPSATEPARTESLSILAPEPAPGEAPAAAAQTPADRVEAPASPPTPVFSQSPLLRIAQIGLERTVVVGGQPEIDAGNVVAVQFGQYTATDGVPYPNSCLPSDGCTVWLGAHRSTHGSTFGRIPELGVGSQIEMEHDGALFRYVVQHVDIVPGASPSTVIDGDLVIQTSWPENQRMMVYAALVR